jgi:N-acyl-D-aspartate/D-glutamate deacylase
MSASSGPPAPVFGPAALSGPRPRRRRRPGRAWRARLIAPGAVDPAAVDPVATLAVLEVPAAGKAAVQVAAAEVAAAVLAAVEAGRSGGSSPSLDALRQ